MINSTFSIFPDISTLLNLDARHSVSKRNFPDNLAELIDRALTGRIRAIPCLDSKITRWLNSEDDTRNRDMLDTLFDVANFEFPISVSSNDSPGRVEFLRVRTSSCYRLINSARSTR